MATRYVAYDDNRIPLHTAVPLAAPYKLLVAPSQICNFKCSYCIQSESTQERIRHNIKPVHMSWDTYSLLIEQTSQFPSKLKRLSFAGYGEPTLNPLLPDMIRFAADKDIAQTIMVVTNGFLLTKELSDSLAGSGLTHLFISLQGLNNAAYDGCLRNNSGDTAAFDRIYNNIRYFVQVKPGNLELIVKIVDTGFSSEEVVLFHYLFDDICDAVGIEQIVQHQLGIAAPSDRDNRYHQGIKKENVKVCSEPFWSFVCYADGTLVPCCGYYFDDNAYSIYNTTVTDYWSGTIGLNKLRRATLIHDMSGFPACTACNYKVAGVHPADILDGHETEILRRMGF